ncbi:MAG: lipocalin family protein [Patescibacteria group bacterium]|nr:lipocalin family protein [Patescibacteria group bacterium]
MRTVYKPIKFPKDEQTHNHLIEWWYFNGRLKDKKDNHYAFMNCLFKVNVKKIDFPFAKKSPIKNFYFAHSIISDIKNQKNYYHIQNAVIVSEDSFSKPLLFINYADPVVIGGYDNSVIEETELFNYKIENRYVDLKLKSAKKPMLVGGNGFEALCGNKSFYYSLTNLKANGRIKIGKKEIEVFGKAWMDHQWANSTAYYNNKWNWFSIQLEDETEIMCVEFVKGNGKKGYLADIIYPDGKRETFKNIIMTPDKFWQSKSGKEKYPLLWKIEIPKKKIKLTACALVKNQEIIAGLANYWEGPVSISGARGNKKIRGTGFMELVNRASPYGKFSLDGVKQFISRLFK